MLKPRGKLFPGPRIAQAGDWRVQLFMDNAACLYERHRSTTYGKTVERWFAVTSFEVTIDDPKRQARRQATAAIVRSEEKRQSKAERLAEEKRYAEIQLQYSLNILFGDLVNELEFGITERLFDDRDQRVLRRVIKRVVDARMMFYAVGEPAPPPPSKGATPVHTAGR